MKKIQTLFCTLPLLVPTLEAANAQVVQLRVVTACGTQAYAAGQNAPQTQDTTGIECAPGNASGVATLVAPLPLTAVSSTQTGVAISSATALTIPSGATTAVWTAQGANNSSGICLYWRDDGTNPTSVAGMPTASLGGAFYKVNSLPISFIQASGATCTVSVSYYK